MARIKVTDTDGGYYWPDESEARRIEKILNMEIPDWTPAGKIAKRLNERLEPVLKTIRLMRSTAMIERKTPQGMETIAEKPILTWRRGEYNQKNNVSSIKYLKAPIYIRRG